ncbi:MAG: winged helix-turn-helix transcriptional regulator [Clostridia bacterium]|nr:winged helix-turn-helix transcriptional regulator [Clostridia bacterium]
MIATVLYYNRTVDAFGTGFERVFKLCGEENNQCNNNQFGFTFEFIRSKDTTNDTINDITNDGARTLTDDEKAALSFFKRLPYATKSALAIELGKSESTVNRLVKRLIDIGVLKHVGPNKGGKWIVMFG